MKGEQRLKQYIPISDFCLTRAATAIVSNEVIPMEETEHSTSDSETNEENREQSDDSDSPWDVSSEEGSAETSGMTTEFSKQHLDSTTLSTHSTIALLRKGGSMELPRILEIPVSLLAAFIKCQSVDRQH